MKRYLGILIILSFIVSSCQSAARPASALPRVLAVESFLADIARNVAGNRLAVDSLIPLDADPHAYQPSPQDAKKIVNADILVINGANLEAFLAPLLSNVTRKQLVITASAGLTMSSDSSGLNPQGDPHFWLDPINVIQYVENIRDGFSKADPLGKPVYDANAQKYIGDLKDLDSWIRSQVQTIPPGHRLLVTNHETFGYFAKQYGFTIVGAIIPSFTSEAATSAKDLAALVTQIRSTGAPAIFLEAGTNPQLADQIASETGVKIVTNLYTHNLSAPGGPASTYLSMMKYDVTEIVKALK